jgi:hypothetical protein
MEERLDAMIDRAVKRLVQAKAMKQMPASPSLNGEAQQPKRISALEPGLALNARTSGVALVGGAPSGSGCEPHRAQRAPWITITPAEPRTNVFNDARGVAVLAVSQDSTAFVRMGARPSGTNIRRENQFRLSAAYFRPHRSHCTSICSCRHGDDAGGVQHERECMQVGCFDH